MAKAAKSKSRSKLKKNEQYERFQQTARELGVDDEKSVEAFEQAFRKIVPSKKSTRAT